MADGRRRMVDSRERRFVDAPGREHRSHRHHQGGAQGARARAVAAALLAELAGARHHRAPAGDRRHIKDRDVELLRHMVSTKLNVEMAATPRW